jgi:HK97 family phage portal protein
MERTRMTALAKLLERRALSSADFDIAPLDSPTNETGINVSPAESLGIIPVWASVSLIADSISALPVHTFRKRGDVREQTTPPRWLTTQPNPEQTWLEFVHRILVSLLLHGNGYAFITGKDDFGFPTEFFTVHPDDFRVERRLMNGRSTVVYVAQDGDIFTRFTELSPQGQIIHFKGLVNGGDKGLSPIEVAQQGVALAKVMETFGARFFGSGQNMSGVIEQPGPPLTKKEMRRLKANWGRWHGGVEKSHLPGVLSGGAVWKPISIPPEAGQFLGSRKLSVTEIARLFRVPPHLIGDVERSTSWGTGIEEQNIGFVQYSLASWISRLEDVLKATVPRGQFIRWNVSGLMRGDIVRRYQAYATGRMNGWLNANEIRAFEDMNPIEGGDEYLVPLNLTNEPGGFDQNPDDTGNGET